MKTELIKQHFRDEGINNIRLIIITRFSNIDTFKLVIPTITLKKCLLTGIRLVNLNLKRPVEIRRNETPTSFNFITIVFTGA